MNRAGIKGRLSNSVRWNELRTMARRWKADQRLKTFRNKVRFHVDRELMRAGLLRICAEAEGRVVIMAGDDRTVGRGAMSLGYIALLNGAGLQLEEYGEIVDIAVKDAGPFRDLVHGVFFDDLLGTMGVL